MCRSSHRADTPRPAGGSRPAGLGTTTARGLNLRGSILGSPFQELRLSRPVVRGVNWAAHRKNPVFAAGLSSGVFGLAGWQRGLRATGPRHSRVQATPTDRAASGAQKSVRRVQRESQAIALTHQGPPGLVGHAGLGTAAERGSLRQQALPAMIRALRLSRRVVRRVNRAAPVRAIMQDLDERGRYGSGLSS